MCASVYENQQRKFSCYTDIKPYCAVYVEWKLSVFFSKGFSTTFNALALGNQINANIFMILVLVKGLIFLRMPIPTCVGQTFPPIIGFHVGGLLSYPWEMSTSPLARKWNRINSVVEAKYTGRRVNTWILLYECTCITGIFPQFSFGIYCMIIHMQHHIMAEIKV